MKVTLERNNLLKALAHVHRVVERRTTIPILSNVLLRAEGGQLHLKATDLDIEISESVAANVDGPGDTTVPAHTLYEIVKKLADGAEVNLETSDDGAQMALSSGRSHFSLSLIAAQDFPNMSAGEFSHTFTVPATDLKELIDRTQFAISTEETRYYLNGIYLHTLSGEDGNLLRAVATDGHRLARAEAPAPSGSQDMPAIIVPRKTVAELQKLVESGEGDITLEVSDTKIRATMGDVILTSKLIDGTFPDYERVIPKNNDRLMKVNRAVFSAAVDRVSTIASERGRAIKLAMSQGQLDLAVTNPDSGTAREELPVEFEAEAMEIGFNAKYLLDIAGQIRTENVEFLFHDSGAPTLVREESEDGGASALYVLMPMRV